MNDNFTFFIVDAGIIELTNECIRRIIKNVKCIKDYKIIICKNKRKDYIFKLDEDIDQKNVEIIQPIYDDMAFKQKLFSFSNNELKNQKLFSFSNNELKNIENFNKFSDNENALRQNVFQLAFDGDIKHGMAIQYALDNYDGQIIFVDSDFFIKHDILQILSTKICSFLNVNFAKTYSRIQPMLMRIDANAMKKHNIKWLSIEKIIEYKTSSNIFQLIRNNETIYLHYRNGTILLNELKRHNLDFDVIENNIGIHLGGGSYKRYSIQQIEEFIKN